MTCNICSHTTFSIVAITRTFMVDGRPVVVEAIPARECEECGELSFDAEVAEQLRRMVREPHEPGRRIEAEVLRYEAA